MASACCAGVADAVAWSLQCQYKVRRAAEALQLLLGPGDATGRPAAVSLKACLGAVGELSKELEALKKDQFEAWQVGAVLELSRPSEGRTYQWLMTAGLGPACVAPKGKGCSDAFCWSAVQLYLLSKHCM